MYNDFLKATDAIKETLRSHEAEPLLYVIAGSRGNRINGANSDFDIVGIHISDVLQPPTHRGTWEVITKQIDEKISLVSYEAWKFLELMTKGAFVAYEIRELPLIFQSVQYDRFVSYMRRTTSLPTGFAYACTGNFKSDWPKDKLSRKKAVMAYFRLCQGVSMLAFGKIDHDAPRLIEKVDKDIFALPLGRMVLHHYLQEGMRKLPLPADFSAEVDLELTKLCDWVEMTAKARKGTGLNQNELSGMLQHLYQDRIAYYGSRMDR